VEDLHVKCTEGKMKMDPGYKSSVRYCFGSDNKFPGFFQVQSEEIVQPELLSLFLILLQVSDLVLYEDYIPNPVQQSLLFFAVNCLVCRWALSRTTPLPIDPEKYAVPFPYAPDKGC
jgi:hypothetical protein